MSDGKHPREEFTELFCAVLFQLSSHEPSRLQSCARRQNWQGVSIVSMQICITIRRDRFFFLY